MYLGTYVCAYIYIFLIKSNKESSTDQLVLRSWWEHFQWLSGWGCSSQPTAWSGEPGQHC